MQRACNSTMCHHFGHIIITTIIIIIREDKNFQRWQLRSTATEDCPVSCQSFQASTTRPIMHQPINSTIPQPLQNHNAPTHQISTQSNQPRMSYSNLAIEKFAHHPQCTSMSSFNTIGQYC